MILENSLKSFSVLLRVHSNSSYDPKALQNWLFSWNKSTAIKAILTSEYFFFINIKNAITQYYQIWAYVPNLIQNTKIWNPHFPFLVHTRRRIIKGSLHELLPPNFQSYEQIFSKLT